MIILDSTIQPHNTASMAINSVIHTVPDHVWPQKPSWFDWCSGSVLRSGPRRSSVGQGRNSTQLGHDVSDATWRAVFLNTNCQHQEVASLWRKRAQTRSVGGARRGDDPVRRRYKATWPLVSLPIKYQQNITSVVQTFWLFSLLRTKVKAWEPPWSEEQKSLKTFFGLWQQLQEVTAAAWWEWRCGREEDQVLNWNMVWRLYEKI